MIHSYTMTTCNSSQAPTRSPKGMMTGNIMYQSSQSGRALMIGQAATSHSTNTVRIAPLYWPVYGLFIPPLYHAGVKHDVDR